MKNGFLSITLACLFIVSNQSFSQDFPKQDLARIAKENSGLMFNGSENNVSAKKSTGLALLYSAILPGMGELYAGNYSSGKYFTAAEVTLWITALGMSTYSTWQENNLKQYAKSKGGVQGDSFDSDFYANVGNYMSLEEYNNEMAFNRDYSAMYDVNTRNWKWNSVTDRKAYRSMWVSSRQANNNIRFATGAMILNRIISMINAVRLVTAHNKSLAESPAVSMDFHLEQITPAESQLVFQCNVNF
jgi:hypothetical protein